MIRFSSINWHPLSPSTYAIYTTNILYVVIYTYLLKEYSLYIYSIRGRWHAAITCLSSLSNLNSRVADSQGRTLVGLKGAENRKKTRPSHSVHSKAHDGSKFLTMAFKFVKTAGMLSMRHSHQDGDLPGTLHMMVLDILAPTDIFNSYSVTATNAAFVNIGQSRGTQKHIWPLNSQFSARWM